jgi:diguanylate cyclase (GGDEF)-like protein
LTIHKQYKPSTTEPGHKGRRLLLVEDSRVFSTLIRYEMQTRHGIAVHHCSSLSAVTTALDAEAFDVAVLDLNLPDAPNCEALDRVLARGIPAIVFTGSFNDSTRDKIMALGVVDCIIKSNPDSTACVVSAVDRLLTISGTNVLVVDEDAERREEMARFLVSQKFKVRQAASVDEAMPDVMSDGIDLIVSPLLCETASAAVILRRLAMSDREITIPVVAVAPERASPRAAQFLRAGGADFLTSDMGADEIVGRMHHAVAVHRRIEALQQLASRDYLTELYNRRYFFQQGKRIVDQSFSRGEASSVAILDIDHFKRLNDTFGHEVGDLVLKAVARALHSFIGGHHLLARLGGEEFGVLLNGLDLGAASDFCEKMRETLARTRISTDDEDLSITVSIGLAPVEQAEVFDNCLHAADQFLYMAKHAGRNRTFSELMMLAS